MVLIGPILSTIRVSPFCMSRNHSFRYINGSLSSETARRPRSFVFCIATLPVETHLYVCVSGRHLVDDNSISIGYNFSFCVFRSLLRRIEEADFPGPFGAWSSLVEGCVHQAPWMGHESRFRSVSKWTCVSGPDANCLGPGHRFRSNFASNTDPFCRMQRALARLGIFGSLYKLSSL